MSNYELKRIYGDITPIDQDDGPSPIAPITYSAECKKLNGCFGHKSNSVTY